MSREAWGDPPETERESCPYCGGTHYMTGCDHCDAVKAKCAAETEVRLLRANYVRLVGEKDVATKLFTRSLVWLGTLMDDTESSDEAELLRQLHGDILRYLLDWNAPEAVSVEAAGRLIRPGQYSAGFAAVEAGMKRASDD